MCEFAYPFKSPITYDALLKYITCSRSTSYNSHSFGFGGTTNQPICHVICIIPLATERGHFRARPRKMKTRSRRPKQLFDSISTEIDLQGKNCHIKCWKALTSATHSMNEFMCEYTQPIRRPARYIYYSKNEYCSNHFTHCCVVWAANFIVHRGFFSFYCHNIGGNPVE